MSADNGIYIGKFADGQYRVIHAAAIDNLWYPSGENAKSIVDYFQDAPVFTSFIDAQVEAFRLADEILSDDFCPILEYGINMIQFSKKFSDYNEFP